MKEALQKTQININEVQCLTLAQLQCLLVRISSLLTGFILCLEMLFNHEKVKIKK